MRSLAVWIGRDLDMHIYHDWLLVRALALLVVLALFLVYAWSVNARERRASRRAPRLAAVREHSGYGRNADAMKLPAGEPAITRPGIAPGSLWSATT